jgi:SRSO17 transposase
VTKHRKRGKASAAAVIIQFVEQNNQAAAAAISVDDAAHAGLLDDLLGEIAPCFPRRETRATCTDMLRSQLAELEDHNCWTMAQAAGHRTPDRMQHFLSRARVDDQGILDAGGDWAAGRLTSGQDPADTVLIIDETGDAKSSTDCVGASRQYSGTLGGIALCQVAVTLTIAAPAGHALIGRSLYLPEDWAADEERRERAGVPDDVAFQTKPQLAAKLLQDAHARGTRAGFVVGDEVYGGLGLRKSIRELGLGYVMAVRSNYPVTLPPGRLSVKKAAALARPGMWQRMQTGQATKGAKDYHWAMIEAVPDDTPEGHDPGHAFLLLRKHRYTGEVSYFLCWSPAPVPLAKLIAAATARWRIEEDHQQCKQIAHLDTGQVTTWTSWHRWTTVSLLAYAYLAVAAAWQRARDGDTSILELIPITIPELARQLRGTVIPDPRRDKPHKNAWSWWRRHRQYQAQQAHKRWNAYADEVPQT